MKYLAWFGTVLVALLAVVYVIVFTSFGNSIIGPILEKEIQKQTKLESKLSTFHLNMSDFDIVLELDSNNSISFNGKYSLFLQDFNISYKLKIDNLQALQNFVKVPVSGNFHTSGTVCGDLHLIDIAGVSDLAHSDTSYHVKLNDFHPVSIKAKVQKAQLALLLHMIGEKAYADADVNLDIYFTDITPHAMNGTISLETQKGKMATKLVKTDFAMNLDAKLKGDDVDYTYILSSNLANITSSGKIMPEPFKADAKYALNIQELAVLKPLLGADIRGALRIEGKIKGDKSHLVIDGQSDLASSDTIFEAVLKEFKPDKIKANIKNMQISKLLYMSKQPHYTDGVLFLDADISEMSGGSLQGIVNTNVKNGLLDSQYITQTYGFTSPMPTTTFHSTAHTVLKGHIIDTKLALESSLLKFDSNRVRFNLQDGSLKSDYKIQISSLDKLYFLTQRHMRGGISAEGEFQKAKDLDLSVRSKVAGGDIDATLHNDDFRADLHSLQTLDILNILIYPEVFKSTLDGKLSYNLMQQKGTLQAHLADGKFVKSQMLDLVKQYVKVDMYIEKFEGELSAASNKENIVASLDLKSNTSSITTKDAKLNSKTKQMDATVTLVANKSPITATLRGEVTSPKISIDLEKLMKSQAGEAIQQEVGKLLQKLF